MSKPRILHFINVRFFNATAWYGIFLSKILLENNYYSTLVGLEGTESYQKAQEMNLPVIGLPYSKKKKLNIFQTYRCLDLIFRETRPDIVNCHRGELFILIALLKRKYGFTLVRTRGDQRPAKNNLFNRILYGKIAEVVIASNSSIKEQLHQNLNVPLSKIHTIIGGVDVKSFFPKPEIKEKIRSLYHYNSKDCVLGLLGRLDPVKGQKESIIALAKAKASGADNLKLLIIGFDELISAQELYALASELNVRDSVYITGKVADVNNVLNACDVAILPSVGSEAIARAALEFMACGIPLISSHVGVMPDLVSEKGRFSTGNTQEMAEFFLKASKALDDPKSPEYNWLMTLKDEQQSLLPALTLEAFMEKTLKAYNQALNSH